MSMLQTSIKPFNDRASQYIGLPLNRQPLELESCSNPLRIQQALKSKSKKKSFVLGLSFFRGNVASRGVFALFWPSFPGPGRRRNGPFFGLKV